MFLPLVMRPLSAAIAVGDGDVRRLAESPVSIVRGPPGSYLAEGLAAAIQGWDRWQDCVWLRPADTRPAVLAAAVAGACLHRWAGRDPDPATGIGGPGADDPEVASRLDDVIRQGPRDAVVVLELGGHLSRGVGRLVDGLRPALTARGISLIAVTETHLPTAPWTARRNSVPAAGLVTARASLPGTLDGSGLDGTVLDRPRRDRLARLAGRRTAVVHDVLDAVDGWPGDAVVEAVDATAGAKALLDEVTAHLLDRSDPAQRAALAVCLAGGYWHPSLATVDVPPSALRPWVVPLEGQWGWLRPIWAGPLRRQLAGRDSRQGVPTPAPVPSGTAGTRRVAAASTRPPPARVSAPAGAAAASPGPTSATSSSAPRTAVLEVRLLGSFEVRVDGVPVTEWRGTRGRSVLRYLVARRRHACARDELLAEFWPDVAPAAARNRLQVAVSGLRRALARVCLANVIEYVDGEYRINPQLHLVVDVEQFEQRVASARTQERTGDVGQAAASCREAMRLYRGDFAADAPYEQWTQLPRESLRMTVGEALDRLSRIEYAARRFDACIATAHRMLDLDPCREDAHRLLMRCYAEQDRVYAALRQHELCIRVLRTTLQVSASRETTQLYHAIRAGSLSEPARIGRARAVDSA
jgi:DNA-binding SARP family transcriptional activator